MGERRCIQDFLVGRPEGKRQLGRSGCRWKNNIKMYLPQWDGGGGESTDLVQDTDRPRALVNAVMNLWIP